MKVLRWTLFLVLGLITTAFLIKTILHVRKTDPGKLKILNAPAPVEVDTAKVRTLSETVGASCSVEQISTATLTTRLDAKVREVAVEIGSLVKKGDPLVIWDTRLVKAQLEASKASLASAETSAKAAEDQIGRLKILMDKGMGSAMELDHERVTLGVAEAQRGDALMDIADYEIQVEESTMVAPFSGVILTRTVNPGEITKKDQEVLKLGALDNVFAVAQVSEERSSAIRIDLEADVTFEAYPSQIYKGRVVRIDPNVNVETRAFPVYIRLENPDLLLKPGQTGFARIRRSKDALAVLTECVMKPFTDEATVFVVDGDKRARLRNVSIGMVTGGYTEILSGIQEGDQVVIAGQLKLQTGDKVNFVERRER